jgi:hypothetical protein
MYPEHDVDGSGGSGRERDTNVFSRISAHAFWVHPRHHLLRVADACSAVDASFDKRDDLTLSGAEPLRRHFERWPRRRF